MQTLAPQPRTIAVRPAGRRSLRQQMWRYRWCYAFLLPSFVLLALFSVYPILASVYFSVFDWNGVGVPHSFVALGNYVQVVHDAFFWGAMGRSLWWAGVTTPAEMIVSLIIAVVLNDRALRLGPVFRTLFFIPVVTTTAVVSIVMSFVFAAYGGPVNKVLLSLHLTRGAIDFLGNPHAVMWTAMLIFVWKWLGQPMIYWLAGLQTIPSELYEAARVDGAGWLSQVRHVSAPLLVPFAVIIALIVGVGNLQVFAFLQALTGGGPYFASETVELYIFRWAFGTQASGVASAQPEFGYASAVGVLFGVLIMAAVAAQAIAVARLRPGAAGVGVAR